MRNSAGLQLEIFPREYLGPWLSQRLSQPQAGDAPVSQQLPLHAMAAVETPAN